MASKLMVDFRNRIAKNKNVEAEEASFDVMYPTGFLTLDFLNGTQVHVDFPDGRQETYNSIGIVDGSSNTFIGRTGCGKSTLVCQIIGNMMRQYPDSVAFFDDIEGSLPQNRKEFLLGLSAEDIKDRCFFRNTGITTESVYYQIKEHHDSKIENRSDYEYDTKLYDTNGNRIFKLIPSFYFIDSFAMLMPKEVVEEQAVGESAMGATATAKKNTELVKKISQLLKDSNIILFTINHILDDIQMGFLPKPVQVDGLKQGERKSGGKTAQYLANNLIRLDEKTKWKDTEGFGINATVVVATLIKSRTNATRRGVPLVFDKSKGAYDNYLSVYQFLKDQGLVEGAGKSMYFHGYPDAKFSQKEFLSKLQTDTNLQIAFSTVAREALAELLSDTSRQKAEIVGFDLNSAILNIA
jgi:RecA/RadA recombinase